MNVENPIPSQLKGKDFLCGSHFSLSNDKRYVYNAMNTTMHRDYIPPPNNLKPEPAVPHKPSTFMHRDQDKINLKLSETIFSYPEKRSVHEDTRDKYDSLYKTNFKMYADDRIDSFQTMQDLHYRPLPKSNSSCLSYLGKNLRESHFPQGDKDKADEPISDYRLSYLKHAVSEPERPSPDFWKSNTITGDNQRRFDTTQQASYIPTDAKPADMCRKNNRYSSIPEGDKEKVSEFTTTATYYYQPHIGNFQPETGIDPYTKLYSTTFTLKDRHGTYDKYKTTTDDSFPPLPYMDTKLKRDRDRNASDIPEGDLASHRVFKRLNHTSTRTAHKPINLKNAFTPRVKGEEKRTFSNVEFGSKALASQFYDTTCDSTFKPVSVPYSKANSYPKSVIPLDYYGDRVSSSATACDFPHHDIKKHGVDRSVDPFWQATHFNPPLEERYFSTTQKDHFVPLWLKPEPTLSKNLQISSLPIGTLGKYIEGSNVV